jgi:hypothetical protein
MLESSNVRLGSWRNSSLWRPQPTEYHTEVFWLVKLWNIFWEQRRYCCLDGINPDGTSYGLRRQPQVFCVENGSQKTQLQRVMQWSTWTECSRWPSPVTNQHRYHVWAWLEPGTNGRGETSYRAPPNRWCFINIKRRTDWCPHRRQHYRIAI